MSDEAPAFEQDQPIDAPEAPETDQPDGGEDSFTESYNPSELSDDVRPHVEAAYKQLQSDYTKKTQTFAEGRREADRNAQIIGALQNPQTRAAVLAQFGVDLVEDAEDESDDEPDLYDRLERVEGELTQRQEAEQANQREEAVLDYISEEIAELEKAEGQEFDAEAHRLLDAYARSNPTAEGYPDVKGAYELLTGVSKARAKAIVEGKKRAPRRPGTGVAGSRQVDPAKESRDERLERLGHVADEARGSFAS